MVAEEVFEVFGYVRLELGLGRVGADQGQDVVGKDVGIGIRAGLRNALASPLATTVVQMTAK